MWMKKREIAIEDCTDVPETADALEWVCKEHMKQSEYHQRLAMDVQTIEQSDRNVWIHLRPDRDLQQMVYDADGNQYFVPSARIEFRVPPLSKDQEVALYVMSKSSESRSATWELVEEIFDGFVEYLRAKGCKVEEGQGPTLSEDIADDIVPDELIAGGKYGTCRDLTIDEVRYIVAECCAFQEQGGKVTTFYEQLNITPGEPRSFELETLRGWLRDPKFAPPEDT
jgi:hypothetical protein